MLAGTLLPAEAGDLGTVSGDLAGTVAPDGFRDFRVEVLGVGDDASISPYTPSVDLIETSP